MSLDTGSEGSPNFPTNFIELPEAETIISTAEGLQIPEKYGKMIQVLHDKSEFNPSVEHYSLLVEDAGTHKRYLSEPRIGTDKGVPVEAFRGDFILREVLHTHDVRDSFEDKRVYSLISNTDLWHMRNEGIQRVWVIAPFFDNALMSVQGDHDAVSTWDWLDAFSEYDKLFGNPKVEYDLLLSKLISLAPRMGLEIFSGKSTDSNLSKLG